MHLIFVRGVIYLCLLSPCVLRCHLRLTYVPDDTYYYPFFNCKLYVPDVYNIIAFKIYYIDNIRLYSAMYC